MIWIRDLSSLYHDGRDISQRLDFISQRIHTKHMEMDLMDAATFSNAIAVVVFPLFLGIMPLRAVEFLNNISLLNFNLFYWFVRFQMQPLYHCNETRPIFAEIYCIEHENVSILGDGIYGYHLGSDLSSVGDTIRDFELIGV